MGTLLSVAGAVGFANKETSLTVKRFKHLKTAPSPSQQHQQALHTRARQTQYVKRVDVFVL